MREIKKRLVTEFQKPVLSLYGANALLDTGTDIPVCYYSGILTQYFHAKKVAAALSIGTFGENVTGDVYEVPLFQIGDLSFPGLRFFVPTAVHASEFLFILSASMFDKLIYEIDKENDWLTIRVPDNESLERHIILYDKDGNKHVLCGKQLNS